MPICTKHDGLCLNIPCIRYNGLTIVSNQTTWCQDKSLNMAIARASCVLVINASTQSSDRWPTNSGLISHEISHLLFSLCHMSCLNGGGEERSTFTLFANGCFFFPSCPFPYERLGYRYFRINFIKSSNLFIM